MPPDPSNLWPPHPHDAAHEVAALAEGVRNTVAMASGLTLGGRRVDLTGLDDSVGLLCAKALDLPPVQGRAARIELLALLNAFDDLSRALRTDDA